MKFFRGSVLYLAFSMNPSSGSRDLPPLESIGGTGEEVEDAQITQLLRLPGRSGLTTNINDDTEIILREFDKSAVSMYTNQVGGHRVLMKPENSSVILKPYDAAEYNFYERCMPLACSSLMPFTARCYGEVDLRRLDTETSSPGSPPKSDKYVMLQDLAAGRRRPSILDIKMGLKQRSIRNFSDKKLKSKEMKSLSTTSHKLGFRIGGAQLYKDGSVVFYNKYLGRIQDPAGTYEILSQFFDSLGTTSNVRRLLLLDAFIDKLAELRGVIKTLKGFRFWSGSLLFIYDCSDELSDEAVVNSATVKMIDFANYTILTGSETPDNEYIYGIESLLTFLKAIRQGSLKCPVLDALPPDVAVQDSELAKAAKEYHNVH
jgi:hypothetical protein